MPHVDRCSSASSGAIRFDLDRRQFTALAAAAIMTEIPAASAPAGQIRALTFDVFGTVTDWRTAIIRDGRELSRRTGIRADWAGFADRWRAAYMPELNRVRRGEIPWARLDALHRHALDRLLAEFGITALSEADRQWFNLVWHRLPAWPEVPAALERLRGHFLTATLSNGNVAMLVDIAKYAHLSWDCILSAELAHHFKPDREVYLKAAELLDVEPNQILMVAAHFEDLEGARAAGLRTAYVQRPQEYGPGYTMPPRPAFAFDFEARDLTHLAEQLGA
jgi:2-haloacid dehalogenase